MESEIKDIRGYAGLYGVTRDGHVFSFRRERFLKHKKERNGYLRVGLWKNQEVKWILIHRLVATAFIDNSNNYPQVNHINGNKEDNTVENLEWCTMSMNNKHAFASGIRVPHNRKFTEEQVRSIRDLYWTKSETVKTLAEKYSVSLNCIRGVITRLYYKEVR